MNEGKWTGASTKKLTIAKHKDAAVDRNEFNEGNEGIEGNEKKPSFLGASSVRRPERVQAAAGARCCIDARALSV